MKIADRFVLALMFAVALATAACTTRDLGAEAAGKSKIGIVYDIGGKDDRSFNAAAYVGALRAVKEGLPMVYRDVEPGDPTSIEPTQRAFAQYGYNLIIGVGFAQGEILTHVAKDYPNLHFVLIDSVAESPNVASLVFK